MKAYLVRFMLTTVVVIPLGILSSERLFAQGFVPFPVGVVPFLKVYYVSEPDDYGDRLVVGEMGSPERGLAIKEQIPFPSVTNQQFCGSVEIAPGLFVKAYVPTQKELNGDFSSFLWGLPDPFTRQFNFNFGEFQMDSFPNSLIPPSRLYGVFAWRIPELSAFSITLSVPIVLSLTGANNSFYTSELTLANRGTANLTLEFNYTAAFGEGSGKVTDTLPAGQQRILPDAIAYLRNLGLSIPTSVDNGGTLTVKTTGLSSPTDIAVTVRTTTALGDGRAGLAYSGKGKWRTFTGALTNESDSPYICGLRQNATDRSNVAVMHAGNPEDGEIVLRLTVISGNAPFTTRTLPDITLHPGGFHQFNEILISNGLSLSNGYVRVERVSGTAPFYAYGVINDQVSSDGSFVPPTLPTGGAPDLRLTIPAMVETETFTSELVLTNATASQKRLNFSFVAEGIHVPSLKANFSIELSARQQLILPNFVQYLRDKGIPGIGSLGTNYMGALFATIEGDNGYGIFIGARTSTASKGGGQFGVFYPGVALEPDQIATTSAWVYGLQQNSETRTNLALVNAGLATGNPSTFSIELFDGATGQLVNTINNIHLESQGWVQFDRILEQWGFGMTSGYACVTRFDGQNPFITYAVVNDGARPGQRTGDGAFVTMQLDMPYLPLVPNTGPIGPWDY